MSMATSTQPTTPVAPLLWKGAGLTALAAVLFPRVNAALYEHERIWHLTGEDAVLAPLVVVLALAVFAAVSAFAVRGGPKRCATASLVCGVLAVLGIVAYWMSIPIILGGTATALGLVAVRGGTSRRRLATFGVALGLLAVMANAALWLANV